MQAHVDGRFFLDGPRVAHIQVALLILQPRDFMLQRTQLSPHALIFRLEASGLLLLPHYLPDLGLQGGTACAHSAGLAASLLKLLLHPCDCSDKILCQLRVLDQPCEECGAGYTGSETNKNLLQKAQDKT